MPDQINIFLDTNIFIRMKYDFTRSSLFRLKKMCHWVLYILTLMKLLSAKLKLILEWKPLKKSTMAQYIKPFTYLTSTSFAV